MTKSENFQLNDATTPPEIVAPTPKPAFLVGEAVWASCGSYGWRSAVVAGHLSRLEKWNGNELEAKAGLVVHFVDVQATRRALAGVEYLQRRVTRYHPEGRLVAGERWPEELRPRDPALRGKDKPRPLREEP